MGILTSAYCTEHFQPISNFQFVTILLQLLFSSQAIIVVWVKIILTCNKFVTYFQAPKI